MSVNGTRPSLPGKIGYIKAMGGRICDLPPYYAPLLKEALEHEARRRKVNSAREVRYQTRKFGKG